MGQMDKPSFDFRNQLSPRYIERLFLHLEPGVWYDSNELKDLLRANGLDVEGSNIVGYNTTAWSLAGLGRSQRVKEGRSFIKLFQLTLFGKQVLDTYSTNRELFYDLMHFAFYSAWHRSNDVIRGRFWLYVSICDSLWEEAPAKTDSFALTNKLQIESRQRFPKHNPAFPERSIRAVFPWLGALTPPFLSKCGSAAQLCSSRRSYCSPQLFHLATDLIYTSEGLKYGTSMAIDDRHIEAICKVCLLDTTSFWQMADLTKMTIRGYGIRKGQWGTSIALDGLPNWIDLPDFTDEVVEANEECEEDE